MSQTSTLLEFNDQGIAKFANHTVYRVPTGHLPRMKDWPGTDIIIEDSGNPEWQFRLKSAASPQQWVYATPSGGTWDW